MGNRPQISSSRDHFLKAGRPWFYLADTVWSAFTNCTPDEWERYLDRRSSQGFNALQINVLPQWDRSTVDFSPQPFAVRRDGTWNFLRIEDEYFEKAQRLLDTAWQRGFTPALVVLWCDFIRGTWACARMPTHEIPLEAIEPFVRYIGKAFGGFDPVFLVSGDTDFKTEDTVTRYQRALQSIKEVCPEALTTFHVQPQAALPSAILNAPELDFYMYQSGHSLPQNTPYVLAEGFCQAPVKRPVVNGEPCYEGHGHGNTYGRFGAFEVRRAIWQSLLSGAKAGVTYGAHGIWSWHKPGLPFQSAAFSSTPYSWSTALGFPGAWDAGYVKWIFETFCLFDLEPRGALGREEIRLATSPESAKVAVYAPYAAELETSLDLSRHEAFFIDLAERAILRPVLRHGASGTRVSMPEVNADTLFVALRK
ncbi:MAG: DUF4038 domain-containing protein [Spirochaetia bacterium]|jgi:hypothetical protein